MHLHPRQLLLSGMKEGMMLMVTNCCHSFVRWHTIYCICPGNASVASLALLIVTLLFTQLRVSNTIRDTLILIHYDQGSGQPWELFSCLVSSFHC